MCFDLNKSHRSDSLSSADTKIIAAATERNVYIEVLHFCIDFETLFCSFDSVKICAFIIQWYIYSRTSSIVSHKHAEHCMKSSSMNIVFQEFYSTQETLCGLKKIKSFCNFTHSLIEKSVYF